MVTNEVATNEVAANELICKFSWNVWIRFAIDISDCL